jgi:hypothetical protein
MQIFEKHQPAIYQDHSEKRIRWLWSFLVDVKWCDNLKRVDLFTEGGLEK